jgi:hypothetical protein
MGGRGRDAAHMARMRAKRAPFTDPRDGRLFGQIRFAFTLSRGEPLSTTKLLKSCYPFEHLWGRLRSWHRTNVARAARRVATPIGRATTPGRPLICKAVPELMELRSPIRRWTHRGSASQRGRSGTLVSTAIKPTTRTCLCTRRPDAEHVLRWFGRCCCMRCSDD